MDFAKWIKYPIADEELRDAMLEVAKWILEAKPEDSDEFAAWLEVSECDRVFCRAMAEHHREGRLTIVDEFGLRIWPGPGLVEWSIANSPDASNRSRPANRKQSINARMLKKMHQDSLKSKECFGWNSKRWARYLNCSLAAVVKTRAWRLMKTYRDASRRP